MFATAGHEMESEMSCSRKRRGSHAGSGHDVAVQCVLLPASPRLVDYSRAGSLVCCCFMGYGWFAGARCARWQPCGRQRTVRGDRVVAFVLIGVLTSLWRAAGPSPSSWPFDRGDSRRHGDSAVVSTVLGDVGAGRVVVRQCGDYGHHLHVVGLSMQANP